MFRACCLFFLLFFFFKQKTAYEMRISDWSSDVCSSDLGRAVGVGTTMLLHCDYVLLAEGTILTTPFVNLALVPEAASSLLLPLRIGHARAFAAFALGEPIAAADAHAWGIANRVVEPAALRPAALEVASRLARQPRASVRSEEHPSELQ